MTTQIIYSRNETGYSVGAMHRTHAIGRKTGLNTCGGNVERSRACSPRHFTYSLGTAEFRLRNSHNLHPPAQRLIQMAAKARPGVIKPYVTVYYYCFNGRQSFKNCQKAGQLASKELAGHIRRDFGNVNGFFIHCLRIGPITKGHCGGTSAGCAVVNVDASFHSAFSNLSDCMASKFKIILKIGLDTSHSAI